MSVVSSKIYLNSYSGPVFNQGSENSCVANAVCQAVRLQSREYHQDTGELARNQIYYDYRADPNIPGTVEVDGGATVMDMLKTAQAVGIATQASAAPYASSLYEAPSASARASASSEKLFGTTSLGDWFEYMNGDKTKKIPLDTVTHWPDRAQQQVSLNNGIDEQLMHGKAVIVASKIPMWMSSIFNLSLAQQNVLHTDDRQQPGGHAFLIVGRDDTLSGGSYICENSWGTAAGERGYFAIPYKFMSDGFWFTEMNVVDGFKGVDITWTKERGDLSKMYVALLGRAADHTGLDFWASAEHNGTTLSSIARSMVDSAEGKLKYGALSTVDYVNTVFTNMTGHAAPASAASGWVYQINYGAGRGEVALAMIDSLLNSTGADHDTFINRGTVSETFAVTYQLDGPLAEAASAIASVTSNADSVQVALTGVQHDLGWMAGNVSTYAFG